MASSPPPATHVIPPAVNRWPSMSPPATPPPSMAGVAGAPPAPVHATPPIFMAEPLLPLLQIAPPYTTSAMPASTSSSAAASTTRRFGDMSWPKRLLLLAGGLAMLFITVTALAKPVSHVSPQPPHQEKTMSSTQPIPSTQSSPFPHQPDRLPADAGAQQNAAHTPAAIPPVAPTEKAQVLAMSGATASSAEQALPPSETVTETAPADQPKRELPPVLGQAMQRAENLAETVKDAISSDPILAAGAAGGTVAVLGAALVARSRKKEEPEDGNSKSETPHSPGPVKENNPPAEADRKQDASRPTIRPLDLAYVPPADWMLALKRVYGIPVGAAADRAIVSVCGQRNDNQDYACLFETRDAQGKPLQCLIVADGCGGHPGGKEAACLAARAASESILRSVKQPIAKRVELAFQAAQLTLARAGSVWEKPAFPNVPSPLRTTLIVVLASATHYHCGWIGDGGIDVHRSSGEWQALLQPHKKGASRHELAATLGPEPSGLPSYATHPRRAGDQLYAGTDGVMEQYITPGDFWSAWFEPQVASGVAPQHCLEMLLHGCGADKYFDDNLTVVYLRTPAQSAKAASAI